MIGQLDIFECFPELFRKPDPEVGEWVEEHGPVIDHIMMPGYIGRKVIMDKSTQSHEWYQCGILEDYFYLERNKCWRAVVNDGRKQRNLIDHCTNYPHGAFLYEVHPWSWPRNVENIEQT